MPNKKFKDFQILLCYKNLALNVLDISSTGRADSFIFRNIRMAFRTRSINVYPNYTSLLRDSVKFYHFFTQFAEDNSF